MNTYLSFTLGEIEAGLASLGESPRDHGRVEMIVCRPDVDQRVVMDQAELDLSGGLVGDSWRSREIAHLEAQITIMNSRIIQALTQDRSQWPMAGDQLFIDLDLSVDNLPPGQRIAIGTVVLEVTAVPHTGCAKFTERYGHDAIRFVNSSEGRQHRRRGMNTRIVQPGVIRVGDSASKVV